jgi:hypothetical protein
MDERSGEIVSRKMAFEVWFVVMRLGDGSARFRNERCSCAA